MAVYTRVTKQELNVFLKGYDIGELLSFEGIEQGVENTNYHLFTTKGRYILTLFEARVNPADLPFFFAFTDHLSDAGIVCPFTIADRNGDKVGRLCGRPTAVISFLEGKGLETAAITVTHCAQLGKAIAKMHVAASSFPLSRVNSVGLPMWKELAAKTGDRAGEVKEGLGALIADELEYLERRWPEKLPRAAVHADIFPDNVFFSGGSFAGVIDFYFTASDFLAYDLALVINAWCFDTECRFVPARFEALMSAYETLRPLTRAEKENLTLLCRGAAMRILMTRLHDWIFHPPGALVKPKDPKEYVAKLEFHRNDGLSQSEKLSGAAG